MDDKGEVRVDGPLENKLIMYSLLESAKDIVRDVSANKSGIVSPSSLVLKP